MTAPLALEPARRWRRLTAALLALGLSAACGEPPTVTPDAPPPFPDAAPTGQGSEPTGPVAINEVAARPETGADWIELASRSDAPVDLSGWFLSDQADRLDHFYVFPAGTVLPPGGYLVVWADDGLPGEGHHAPFGLARADGVVLLGPDGLTVDSFLFLAPDGGSLARVPDREGLFWPTAATPAAPNPEALP